MNGYIVVAIFSLALVIFLGLLISRRKKPRRRSSSARAEPNVNTAANPAAMTASAFIAALSPPADSTTIAGAAKPMSQITDSVIAIPSTEPPTLPPEFSIPDENAPRSELLAHVTMEESRETPGRVEAFLIWANVRILEDDRPRLLKREVSLTIRGPDEMDYPAETTNPAWQRMGRKEFYYLGDSYKPKSVDMISGGWLPVLRVPVNELEMPRQGRSQLRALVSWRDRTSQLFIARGLGVCVFNVLSNGVLDRREEHSEPDWLVARVLGLVLHQSGAPTPAAEKEVEKWLEMRTATTADKKRAQRYRCERLNKVMTEYGHLPAAERETAARDACSKLVRAIKSSDRDELLALFHRLLDANGRPDPQLAANLADWLAVGPASGH